jgi:hypothetical protein
MTSKYPIGSPQRYAEELYWEFNKFENLTTDEVKDCCCIVLKRLMEDGDTAVRVFYGEARNFIKRRGVIV